MNTRKSAEDLWAQLREYPRSEADAQRVRSLIGNAVAPLLAGDWCVWGPPSSRLDGTSFYDAGYYDVAAATNDIAGIRIVVYLFDALDAEFAVLEEPMHVEERLFRLFTVNMSISVASIEQMLAFIGSKVRSK